MQYFRKMELQAGRSVHKCSSSNFIWSTYLTHLHTVRYSKQGTQATQLFIPFNKKLKIKSKWFKIINAQKISHKDNPICLEKVLCKFCQQTLPPLSLCLHKSFSKTPEESISEILLGIYDLKSFQIDLKLFHGWYQN